MGFLSPNESLVLLMLISSLRFGEDFIMVEDISERWKTLSLSENEKNVVCLSDHLESNKQYDTK